MPTHVSDDRLEVLVLAWLWCQRGKPAGAAAVLKGLKALLPAGSTAQVVADILERLVRSGHAERTQPARKGGKPTFRIVSDGERRASEALAARALPAGSQPFGTLSSYTFPAQAAGLAVPGPDKKSQAAFGKLLPLAVCARHHRLDVPLDRGPDAGKLALVKLALSQAQGVPPDKVYLKKLPGGELPALVAGPLLDAPGTLAGNLDKLLATAACTALGVTKRAQIKAAVVRRWVADGATSQPPQAAAPTAELSAEPPADVDLAIFAHRALAAARDVARAGGDGVSNLGDKVLVNACWRRFEQMFGPVPLDRFKQRLSDANGDLLVLVREDLIPDDRRQAFLESEVRRGASSFHYVRVGNLGVHYAAV